MNSRKSYSLKITKDLSQVQHSKKEYSWGSGLSLCNSFYHLEDPIPVHCFINPVVRPMPSSLFCVSSPLGIILTRVFALSESIIFHYFVKTWSRPVGHLGWSQIRLLQISLASLFAEDSEKDTGCLLSILFSGVLQKKQVF